VWNQTAVPSGESMFNEGWFFQWLSYLIVHFPFLLESLWIMDSSNIQETCSGKRSLELCLIMMMQKEVQLD
jgi:hypothetical protein